MLAFKVALLCVTLELLNTLNAMKLNKNKSLVAATNGFISDFFEKKSSNVYIIKSRRSSTQTDILITQFMRSEKLSFQIEDSERVEKLRDRRRNSVILLIESFGMFEEINKCLTSERFDFDGFYLLVLVNGLMKETQAMLEVFWMKYISNVNVLFYNASTTQAGTIFPFNSGFCNDTSLKIIATFTNGAWNSTDLFPKKFKNLQRCPFKVATFEFAPSIIKKTFPNGSFHVVGGEMEMFEGLATSLNFKIDLEFMASPWSWGVVFPNGTSTGNLHVTQLIGIVSMIE